MSSAIIHFVLRVKDVLCIIWCGHHPFQTNHGKGSSIVFDVSTVSVRRLKSVVYVQCSILIFFHYQTRRNRHESDEFLFVFPRFFHCSLFSRLVVYSFVHTYIHTRKFVSYRFYTTKMYLVIDISTTSSFLDEYNCTGFISTHRRVGTVRRGEIILLKLSFQKLSIPQFYQYALDFSELAFKRMAIISRVSCRRCCFYNGRMCALVWLTYQFFSFYFAV